MKKIVRYDKLYYPPNTLHRDIHFCTQVYLFFFSSISCFFVLPEIHHVENLLFPIFSNQINYSYVNCTDYENGVAALETIQLVTRCTPKIDQCKGTLTMIIFESHVLIIIRIMKKCLYIKITWKKTILFTYIHLFLLCSALKIHYVFL